MDLFIILVSGFVGALVDSILGATVQGLYIEDDSGEILEKRGDNGRLIRGLSWVDNDVVNLACALSGGLTAFLIGL